ncbi:MAG: radical SAM protein, partial [Thermoprotei archaeon]
IMPAKAAPYKVDEWPDIVEDAFAIMHIHNKYQQRRSYSASQVGRGSDLKLLGRLKDYRSLIISKFFVPSGSQEQR